eukprot:CAMPEP_0170519006 /NCGR_PEP_ID=MMETSP0209-20121228/4560_1 /TAXON_ID=665100 ORGANISM="Litonotus pictus, Strain P1" /NCGR_SAMPLE_ID=MMETSP0209 /ASSEMBLY_ACC=CAM_ASM_000301 /LENGTH=458 /DNA_ID=CAMNT_0010804771 /DNA_START=575 /DNA_END=1948 /DNA_ORIENTATION=+
MKNEIYQRGPITCGIAITKELFEFKEGIFEDITGELDVKHEVSVVGYGEDVEENGDLTKWWLIRGNWGVYWGDNGFIKIIRGKNNLNIESRCSWAVPKDTWTENVKHVTTEEEKNDPNNETKEEDDQVGFLGKTDKGKEKAQKFKKSEDLKWKEISARAERMFREEIQGRPFTLLDEEYYSESPLEYIPSNSLPENFDWRNLDGKNYCSVNKNQHIPHYCGSCWAHATTSALADRFNILNRIEYGISSAPDVNLSVQSIVYCQNEKGDSCHGGNADFTYQFIKKMGVPHDTCLQYTANDSEDHTCKGLNRCEVCHSPLPKPHEKGDSKDYCFSVEDYPIYYVKEQGKVHGVEAMKKEIFARGPIACYIETTPKMHAYKGGIYYEHVETTEINHVVSLVGWGKEEDKEYWILRNSWGTYWGENGYMRIEMHKNVDNIESYCFWATPTYTKEIPKKEVID